MRDSLGFKRAACWAAIAVTLSAATPLPALAAEPRERVGLEAQMQRLQDQLDAQRQLIAQQAERSGIQAGVQLPMTHFDIADHLNLTLDGLRAVAGETVDDG